MTDELCEDVFDGVHAAHDAEVERARAMGRKITPHKGGRTVKKSLDVTPETNTMLYYLKKKTGMSLGDLVEWAVREKIAAQGGAE